MLFGDVIGQDVVKQQLRQGVQSERIPHAQLFLGPQGSGKLALAIAFARYILCTDRQDGDACNQCPACLKSARLIHPDLHFSFPFTGASRTSNDFLTEWRSSVLENPYQNINQWLQAINAENKQGNINKEECLNIIRKLSLKSFESDYKILIIWLPEYLGKEGNRLLKLIEEPPERTFFVLVAEQQEKILNTILSRCQLVKIPALSDDEIVAGLQAREQLPSDRVSTIARLANGNFNEAQNLIAQSENDYARLFLEWMRKCYIGNGVELVTWVEQFATIGRENQKQFMRYALHFMREYMQVKLGTTSNVRLPETELKTAQNLTKVIGIDQVGQISALLDDCFYYVERNANPKVLFLNASIKMHQLLKPRVAVSG